VHPAIKLSQSKKELGCFATVDDASPAGFALFYDERLFIITECGRGMG
jgi:hypothetical protein